MIFAAEYGTLHTVIDTCRISVHRKLLLSTKCLLYCYSFDDQALQVPYSKEIQEWFKLAGLLILKVWRTQNQLF